MTAKRSPPPLPDPATLREMALQKLQASAAPIVPDDYEKLLHELQVHQVELQIQNETLLESSQNLEAALTRYSQMFDFAPLAYLRLGSQGVIIEGNHAAADFLQTARPHLRGMRLRQFVSTAAQREVSDFLLYTLASDRPGTLETTLSINGKTAWVVLQATAEAEGDGLLLSLTDITERKLAEQRLIDLNADLERCVAERTQELQVSQDRLKYALEASNIGIWDWNGVTEEAYYTLPAGAIPEYEPGNRDISAIWRELIHPDERTAVLAANAENLKHSDQFELEYRLRHRDGSYRWVLVRGQVLARDANGAPLRAIGTHTDIHERKQLEARNRQLAAIVEASTDLIATCSPKLDMEYMNAAGRRLLGIDPTAPAASIHIPDVHTAAEGRRILEVAIPTAIAEGRWQGDTIFLTRDGRSVAASQLILAPIDPTTGRIEFLTTICRDITERQQALQKLRVSQRMLETAERLAKVGAWAYYPERDEFWPSAQWQRITGEGASCLKLADVMTLVPPEDLPVIEEAFHQTLQSGQAFDIHHRLLQRSTGAIRHVHVHGESFLTPEGRVKKILGATQDITYIVTTRKALEESEQRYREIIESAQEGIWVLDNAARTTLINPAMAALLGYPAEEIMGRCITDFIAESMQAKMKDLLQWQAECKTASFECEFRRKDGGVLWGHLSCNPLDSYHKTHSGLLVMFMDITERKALEAKIQQHVLELEASDSQKTQFIAVLAHELRNPLSPLSIGAQMLRKPDLADDQRSWCHSMILRQVQHLSKLVDDLLDISRITQGKIELELQRVDLNHLVQDTVRTVLQQGDRARHEVILILPSVPAVIEGDPVRLTQVLTNLLNNAAKFTPPGSRITVTLERDAEAEAVTLRVKDNGIGIDPDMLERIFDMFAQASNSTTKPNSGLGIGLHLARQLVVLHGGTLQAHSRGRGQGSEFVMRLPVGSPLTGEELPAPMQGGDGLKILVVDDNVDAANSMGLLLSTRGNTLRIVYSGAEALEAAEAFRPDLVITDINMPNMNGYELCRCLRERPWAQSLDIVALTGWGQTEDKQTALEAGFTGHLTKPLVIEELDAMLASCAQRSHGP